MIAASWKCLKNQLMNISANISLTSNMKHLFPCCVTQNNQENTQCA